MKARTPIGLEMLGICSFEDKIYVGVIRIYHLFFRIFAKRMGMMKKILFVALMMACLFILWYAVYGYPNFSCFIING